MDEATGFRMMVEERRGVAVAKVTAEDFSNPSLLEDTFQTLVSRLKGRKVVVDMADIESTISLGIAVLVAAQGLSLIHETELAFAAVSPKVKKLLAMVGADKVLKSFGTVEDAIDALQGSPSRTEPNPPHHQGTGA